MRADPVLVVVDCPDCGGPIAAPVRLMSEAAGRAVVVCWAVLDKERFATNVADHVAASAADVHPTFVTAAGGQ